MKYQISFKGICENKICIQRSRVKTNNDFAECQIKALGIAFHSLPSARSWHSAKPVLAECQIWALGIEAPAHK